MSVGFDEEEKGKSMPIALAADHAGFPLKEKIKAYLSSSNREFIDFGTHSTERTDYPDFGFEAAKAVAKGRCSQGILICGSGIGMAIVANKVKGVRAALCTSATMAKYSRLHNDANVLTLGARIIGEWEAMDIVETWLTTEFEGGRHLPRIEKIHRLTGM